MTLMAKKRERNAGALRHQKIDPTASGFLEDGRERETRKFSLTAHSRKKLSLVSLHVIINLSRKNMNHCIINPTTTYTTLSYPKGTSRC